VHRKRRPFDFKALNREKPNGLGESNRSRPRENSLHSIRSSKRRIGGSSYGFKGEPQRRKIKDTRFAKKPRHHSRASRDVLNTGPSEVIRRGDNRSLSVGCKVTSRNARLPFLERNGKRKKVPGESLKQKKKREQLRQGKGSSLSSFWRRAHQRGS